MDDPLELSTAFSPEELDRLERSDYCATLYTIWDRLRERGRLSGNYLLTCRNDSNVPDELFLKFTRQALPACESIVDKGEVIVLAPSAADELRSGLAVALSSALDAL